MIILGAWDRVSAAHEAGSGHLKMNILDEGPNGAGKPL